MDWGPRRERLRAILEGDRCVFMASVHEALAGRMAEDLGFEVGTITGSTASLAVLGEPDHMLITLSELTEQVLRVNRACNLPLMVDGDDGYGNALNVMRTVAELETAGAAAITIEDTVLPQPFGGVEKAAMRPIEEGVGRMRAALEARQDPRLVIAGRTPALAFTTVDDAIARCTAYEKAGVDAIFAGGAASRDHIEAVSAALSVPLFLGGDGYDAAKYDLAYLASQRVRLSSQGHMPIRAAIQAMYDTLKALRDGADHKSLPGIASADLLKQVSRAGEHDRRIKDYLGGE